MGCRYWQHWLWVFLSARAHWNTSSSAEHKPETGQLLFGAISIYGVKACFQDKTFSLLCRQRSPQRQERHPKSHEIFKQGLCSKHM